MKSFLSLKALAVSLAFLFFSDFCFAASKVMVGLDVVRQTHFAVLKNRNVALITNHTGVDSRGKSTAQVLKEAPNVHLRCILSPEHGFHGTVEHGQKVQDETDNSIGVPVYSLYGATSRPTDAMLQGVDTIVFDIQDVGTRFYTYITTMGMALEEASKRRLRFVVLDRPNPIRGDVVEGDILDPDIKRMTGYFSIPTRHGLTVGEIAAWMNNKQNLRVDLHVVRMKGWKRHEWFSETGLRFIPPSPNIPRLPSAILYPGIGCFEATNVSVGRGTETPFEVFGAPWINGKSLCARLRQTNFPGVIFEPVSFTPEKDLYQGQTCEGVRIIITNRNQVRSFNIFVASFLYLQEMYRGLFVPEWEEVRVVTGSNKLKDLTEGTQTMEELLDHYDKIQLQFLQEIKPFYLYE